MMGLLWVTFILLATQVTCSLAVSCDLPSPLNSTKASELLRNYSDAGGNTSCSGVTVLQLIEFALNTTGDTTLTKSKLNWPDTCFDHYKFTLRQVALINGKELDQFPGNAKMDDVHMLVTSDATKAVVQDVNQTLNTLKDRNVTLDSNLDSFIGEVGFIVKKESFISILSYSLKSGNYSTTAALVGYDQRLINATLPQAAEYLLLTEEELKKNLTLECVVRHLRSAKIFTQELLDYIKKQREIGSTVVALVSTEDANILTQLKITYKGNNLTSMQFLGERKVELKYLDYTIAEISMVTQVESAIIKSYTIEKLFNVLYEHADLLLVYKSGVQASKTMRMRILKHYQITSESVLKDQFNLTSQLGQFTDIEYENYAIRFYIHRYATKHLNTTFQELEKFAKLQSGSLKNATVNDFPELMSEIGVAYAVKALNESTYLKWLLDNHTALVIHMNPLKEQIEKDRQPLTITKKVIYVDFEISYIIHLKRLSAAVFYERSVFNFTGTLDLKWHSFLLLFDLNDNETNVLKGLFMKYSFKDISRFFGIKMYTIFTWKFEVIITRLLYLNLHETNECTLGTHSCPRLSTCDNYIGGYACRCRPGYNVDPDNHCRDVDECKLWEYMPMIGICPYNGSRCNNTYGSFDCVCPDGYKKDNQSVLCVDRNECLEGSPCSSITHSECVNKLGSYECRCKSGFNATYNETVSPKVLLNCADIDECKGNPCSNVNNSECVNKDGSHECRCKSGYNATYNETVSPRVLLNCTANDRCSRPELNRCHRNANCSNTIGGYKCMCNKGYEGDGYSCEDKNECSTIFNKCVPNAICRNLPGTYECLCDPGFEFNDKFNYCKDINECLPRNSNPCSNVTHSECINKRGSYECRCSKGYNATYNETVSPKLLLNCTDIDECSRSELNRCHRNANCSNTIGSYSCTCKKGYVGNGVSCKENRVIDPILLRLIYITRTTRVRPFLGFYYGGKVHSKIYISLNGIISIGKRYRRSTPKSCANRRLKKDILAPFWASSAGGQIGYQQFAKEEDNAAPVLERINEIVDQTTNLTGFEANWALVVAWNNIVPKYCSWFCWLFWRNPYRDETNTFQAILATNGSTSVVMFLYDDNGMNWHRRLGRKAMVGYATKSGACKEYQGSFTESIFDVDDQSFTDPAGTSRKGVIVIVFSKGNEPQTPEEQCLSWIRNQPKDNEWMEDIPSCPCTRRAARFDSRFEYWSRTSQRICYAYIKREYTKTCCYFRGGFWTRGALITSARLAGRVSRYSPVSKRSDYENHDEKPFKLCCIESTKYCDDFSQYRPVENRCSNQAPRPCSCQWNFGWRIVIRRIVIRRRWRVRRWWQRAPRRGWFFGDPHITTLDGFKYSFNGLGDYVLLATSDKSHTLHGKTVRPPFKDTNELSNATVFSGFAMRNKKNTTVQVLFSDSTLGNLSILVKNSTNFCQSPFGITDLKSAPGFVLKKSNDTLIVMFEDSGFSVEITPGIGLLQISFSVPPELADKNTTGLLGKLNGDKADDLTYPNGTALSTDSTDKKIFAFGQTWKVQDGEELFEYDNCSKMPVFFDGNFRPTFLSDFDNSTSKYQSISSQCGGNKQCILDILLTGNEALGLATLKFDKENDEKRAAMDNQPPDITVTPEVINVTVNQAVTVNVNVSDPNDGDTVTLSDTGNLPPGATFNNITGIFSWTPLSGQQDLDFKIEFAARDQQDAAQVKSVAVKFCDCKYGQECDFTNILRSNTNNSFELVGCNCSEGYSGDHCETKNDPCADDPCYGNVTCTANVAPAAYGYTCGSCPDGLVGNGEDCNDFDECINPANNTCKLNETCVNTVGSYRCQCKPGYKVQTTGGNCTDVDECNPIFGNNDCDANTAVCTNTIGSHNCTCKEGYEGNPKQGCTDIDECSQDGRCNHKCENTPGSFNCTCSSGFELKKTSPGHYTCIDVDECKYPIENDCEQICQNVPSSFRCSCRDGYILDQNNKTCSVNNSCSSGHGCSHGCIVSGQNQCQCHRGYELLANNRTCQDINECSRNLDGCAHNCTNGNGNYSCSCLPGHKLMANKRDCEEIDECKKDNGGCEHKCTNTPGSRRCSCKRGYELADDKMKCKDIDECKAKSCKHGQKCKNKKGGYKCRCPPGRFSDGTFGCRRSKRFRLKIRLLLYIVRTLVWNDDLNDDFSDHYISFSRTVVIEINKYFRKSRYRNGYMGCRVNSFNRGSIIANVSLNFDPNTIATSAGLQQDVNSNAAMGALSYDPQQSSVSDVNECNDPEENDCHENATCANTDGSYNCSCKVGYSGSGVECVKVKDKVEVIENGDNTALIIGLSIGLSLLVIIIIIIILICCYRRHQKGRLPVTEEHHGMRPMRISKRPDSGEVYYGDSKGRRGSDSFEGRYDVAAASANYYDNPGMKKDESFDDRYDVATAPNHDYENPVIKKDPDAAM